MNTRQRAETLAAAAAEFPFLGTVDADALCELTALELGDAEALDGFRPRATGFSHGIARSPLLHIVSGNTPHAALQSLLRGLLLGAHNRIKLPSAGLPEVDHFCSLLPAGMRSLVEISITLPDSWVEEAAAVLVFGSDETIDTIHARLRADQIFLPHGHRMSFGIIFEDPLLESARGAARDASLFDQQGCLSPHFFYVADPDRLEEFAKRLAAEMQTFDTHTPRQILSPEDSAKIQSLREEWRFRASTKPGVVVHASPHSTAWTVIVDPYASFHVSVLNRVVYVLPLPDDLKSALQPVHSWLSTVGIHPCTPDHSAKVLDCGISRICPIGKMQNPPLHWHQDGNPTLSSLVRWVDFEPLN